MHLRYIVNVPVSTVGCGVFEVAAGLWLEPTENSGFAAPLVFVVPSGFASVRADEAGVCGVYRDPFSVPRH